MIVAQFAGDKVVSTSGDSFSLFEKSRFGEKLKGKIEYSYVESLFLTEEKKMRVYVGSKELDLNGVFGAIGHIPLSDLAAKLGVKINEKKEIMIDRGSKTNIPGVFAAGDVVDSGFKQAITGVAEGVVAAHSAYTYINENEFVCFFEDPNYKK